MLVSTRAAGDMAKERNRCRLFESYGFDYRRAALSFQVHGKKIGLIRNSADIPETRIHGFDGWLNQGVSGVSLGIFTADCLPVFIIEPEIRLGVLLHAGWRGIAGGIIEEARMILERQFEASAHRLVAAIGPHIRVCCYEVGESVAKSFPNFMAQRRGEKIFLDLEKGVISRLSEWGVQTMSVSADCTKCSRNPQFYSRRKDPQGIQLALLHF